MISVGFTLSGDEQRETERRKLVSELQDLRAQLEKIEDESLAAQDLTQKIEKNRQVLAGLNSGLEEEPATVEYEEPEQTAEQKRLADLKARLVRFGIDLGGFFRN